MPILANKYCDFIFWKIVSFSQKESPKVHDSAYFNLLGCHLKEGYGFTDPENIFFTYILDRVFQKIFF